MGVDDLTVACSRFAVARSGDHDFVVPFTSTRAWVYSMDLEVEKPYAAWIIDQQVCVSASVCEGRGRPGASAQATVPSPLPPSPWALLLPPTSLSRAFFSQVAGFYTKFKLGGGLTFATVKGAGHMVPSSNPREALELVSRFMDGDL